MCTAFSCLQALNWARMDPTQKAIMISRARTHLHVCLKRYNIQLKAGRYFLHEHLATATSWKDPKVINFMRRAGVDTTVMHA
eukprot:8849694-Heterocapsa_arctica.AAC.1